MAEGESSFSEITENVRSSSLTGLGLRQFAMEQLQGLGDYDWSGIYRLEGDTLILDAYCGAPTDHTHIPVGRGVCGTAVAKNQNQVVADVRDLENYLACSLETRSEIVVLIRRGSEILGQIDIDGHRVNAFTRADEEFLEGIAEILAAKWEGE